METSWIQGLTADCSATVPCGAIGAPALLALRSQSLPNNIPKESLKIFAMYCLDAASKQASVCNYVYVYICMCVYTHLCVCICMCTHTRTRTRTHTHTIAHTHTETHHAERIRGWQRYPGQCKSILPLPSPVCVICVCVVLYVSIDY